MRALKRGQREVFWVLACFAAIVLASVNAFHGPARAESAASGAASAAERCQADQEGRLGEGVTRAWCSMEVREVTLRSAQGEEIAFEARIAQNDLQRQAGYQAIHEDLVKSTATLFLFPRAIYGAFHMCNVTAPLWIVWYQEDGTPLDARRMLPGKTLPAALCDDVYAPRRRGLYRYALEIGEELARELGLGASELARYRLRLEAWMGQAR